MENIEWKEFKTNVRSFRLGDEPEVIHIIKLYVYEDDYLLIHEDAYGLHTGKTEFLKAKDIKEKYGIEIENNNEQL